MNMLMEILLKELYLKREEERQEIEQIIQDSKTEKIDISKLVIDFFNIQAKIEFHKFNLAFFITF